MSFKFFYGKQKISRLTIYLLLIVALAWSCKDGSYKKTLHDIKTPDVSSILVELENSNSNNIIVVAHRGDWRNAPENSIQAIKNSIEMGVDMVEIDVRKTKDNHLVVIHDKTLNRTTTGKGLVSEWTLDSLKTLYLKNGVGHPSKHKIPTLKEALLEAKDKILINLDKCYNYFDEAYNILIETETIDQVVVKGFNKTIKQVKSDFGTKLDSIIFMPVINLDKQTNAGQIIEDYQRELKPLAFEIVFSQDTSKVLNTFSEIKNKGSRIWVNSLWGSLNANHDDDSAVENLDGIYGWYLKKGINIIQTDRPEMLLKYLRSKGLHN